MECLSLRDACFHVYGGEIEISVWGREEGRKEADNPCGLLSQTQISVSILVPTS